MIAAGTIKAQFHSNNKKDKLEQVAEEDRKVDDGAKSARGTELRDVPEQLQTLVTQKSEENIQVLKTNDLPIDHASSVTKSISMV